MRRTIYCVFICLVAAMLRDQTRAMGAPINASGSATVGFDRVTVPRAAAKPLQAAIWYPSTSHTVPMSLGMRAQDVAENGAIAGESLPLIVISHGAFGTWEEHLDTAAVLARAGFVVAAVSHDDFNPRGELKLTDRSRQLTQLIDFALLGWRGRNTLNKNEVGAFGFSIGGFTVLVAAGGKPDPRLIAPHCKVAGSEWSCLMAAQHRLDFTDTEEPPGRWSSDLRIKAEVVAAPALGYLFGKTGLATVRIPIQLWQAGADQTLTEPWNAQAIRQDMPRPVQFHLVPAADHGDFAAPCMPSARPAVVGLCGGPTGFDRAAFHRTFNEAVVRFFTKWLIHPDPRR